MWCVWQSSSKVTDCASALQIAQYLKGGFLEVRPFHDRVEPFRIWMVKVLMIFHKFRLSEEGLRTLLVVALIRFLFEWERLPLEC